MLIELLLGDSLWGRVLRFVLVGGSSTLAYGALAVAAVDWLGIDPVPATVLAYVAVMPLNFLLQRSFTFRSTQEMRSELPRFLLVHGLNIAGSFALMLLVVEVLHVDYRWAVAGTMTFVPVLVFLAMDSWVFRRTRL
jgi:putative flippase GtrA